jgi:hypothetical protein
MFPLQTFYHYETLSGTRDHRAALAYLNDLLLIVGQPAIDRVFAFFTDGGTCYALYRAATNKRRVYVTVCIDDTGSTLRTCRALYPCIDRMSTTMRNRLQVVQVYACEDTLSLSKRIRPTGLGRLFQTCCVLC